MKKCFPCTTWYSDIINRFTYSIVVREFLTYMYIFLFQGTITIVITLAETLIHDDGRYVCRSQRDSKDYDDVIVHVITFQDGEYCFLKNHITFF